LDASRPAPDVLHDAKQYGDCSSCVEQLLGHTLGGVMAVYNRSQYLPEKLDALNKWMERLEVISSDIQCYYSGDGKMKDFDLPILEYCSLERAARFIGSGCELKIFFTGLRLGL
jgi:hypothetical protein